MHPSGFDTRAIASDEAAFFLFIASSPCPNASYERLHDILEANRFLQKIDFVKEVLKVWIRWGGLGGRPPSSYWGPGNNLNRHSGHPPEIFWEGTQERTSSGGKFVWVTVGAPGGDGEYISISPKQESHAEGQCNPLERRHEREIDSTKERPREVRRG
jgi:hypothetical protein